MKACRECTHEISERAPECPHCGAPYPARDKWDGCGFEYKSQQNIWGLPLLHISFKSLSNRRPVVAKGLIAICQFTIAGYALAQFAIAYSMSAQMGILHPRRP
jgi:hypothetical protein